MNKRIEHLKAKKDKEFYFNPGSVDQSELIKKIEAKALKSLAEFKQIQKIEMIKRDYILRD
jgi:hypothetical protein